MNFSKERDRNRLSKALSFSWRQLRPFRRLTTKLTEEYSGPGYGGNQRRKSFETLLNLSNQTVDAYTMALVANRPRILVTTPHEKLQWFGKQYQLAINKLIEEIHLEETLRQAVLDAFFCIGIVKVHMADSGQVELEEGIWMDPGTPFASNVSIDNWCHDTQATEWHKVKFAADSYRLPLSDVQDSDIFDRSVAKDLTPTSKHLYEDGDERLESISKGEETDIGELEPMVDLMDVWIPRERRIYTFAMDRANPFDIKSAPLADMEWDGDESGPYELLAFNDVPQNIMPTPPASHLTELSRLINNLARKQGRRARAAKRVHLYNDANAGDAANIQRANDDEFIRSNDPDAINTVTVGGVDPSTQQYMLQTLQLYDRMAGNLTAMLGLGAQADTVGQEQLIHGAVSKKEAQMQYRTVDFASKVIRKLGRLLWDDVAKVIPGTIEIPGSGGINLDATWKPGEREGDYKDFQLDVDVHSMPYRSPAVRLQALNQMMTQVYAPLAQLLTQQGGQINLQKMTDIYAELMNEPRLREIVEFGAPLPSAGDEGEGMPSTTTRNYVRSDGPKAGVGVQSAGEMATAWNGMPAMPENGGMG